MYLSGLLRFLRQTEAYQELVYSLRAGEPVPDQHMPRAATPYLLAALAEDIGRPILVLSGPPERAHTLSEQIPVWRTLRSPTLRFSEPGAPFYVRAPWPASTIHERLSTLGALVKPINWRSEDAEAPQPLIVASAYALMEKTLPAREFRARSRLLRVGMRVEMEKLLRTLQQIGYTSASVVVEAGTFSRRGGIVDVYPITANAPARIEFFGDEIESLRTFAPSTQRSQEPLKQVVITPAREALPLHTPALAERLRDWFAALPKDDPASPASDYEPLSLGATFPQMEFYLPLLHAQLASLLAYLPENALIVVENWGALQDAVETLEEQAVRTRQEREAAGYLPPNYPIPYMTWAELQDELSFRDVLHLGAPSTPSTLGSAPTVGQLFAPQQRYGGQLRRLMTAIAQHYDQSETIVVVTPQAQRLADLASEQGLTSRVRTSYVLPFGPTNPLTFIEQTLSEGWQLSAPEGTLHILTDAEIFGWQRAEPRRRPHKRATAPEEHFADLHAGDYVVHTNYGIGRFVGLQRRTLDGHEREYLVVEYAGGDLLYVPIHQADRLTRYVGVGDQPPQVHRLGTPDWQRAKKRTQRAVQEVARELLELYAAREHAPGHAFSPDTPWQRELEASFPYLETEDQLRALHEVKADMERPRPMDRVICGDVGYGKTEVALRAAFKAVADGKQVAMLVPTTVLAQQHYNTFRQRLHAFPIMVEMLSRFRTPAEQRRILHGLAQGTVDIVIGTHRLLQGDVQFKDLGLLIIDEEQRFGVTHKEYLKQMRTEVDVLTLTATPIPRTLYMSLSGIRDISMIQTPPDERLPVQTYIGPYDEKLVRQAIVRELDRGGQVFFVHNRVRTIHTVAARLKRLVPEARIAVGHGQMPEAQLESVMAAFARGEHDVLVSTTIIESGLDIPNANTLIVDRADWFGLAQLYQLRGRVGRAAAQAYAYFFHPSHSPLTPEARARLETIGENTQLGAGFSIALRDMEIRGVGDLLGTRQSGHIAAVGFHLYTQLLAQAVRHLRGETEGPTLPIAADNVIIDLPVPAYLPASYIPEAELRIQIYRRLAQLETLDSIDAMAAELADRFGPLPRAVKGLLFQLRVKLLALRVQATAISLAGDKIGVHLPYLANVDRAALQEQLGHNVHVSRVAVWLPVEDMSTAQWQVALLDILEKLRAHVGKPA